MGILRKLVIEDISAVDRPANKLARATIMKRDTMEVTKMTDTEQEYLAECSPKEKADYLAASPADRKKIIAADANDAEDTSTTKRLKFTKAEANAEWDRALEAYAVRNKLTKSAAAAEFSTTIEAKNIYNKILRAPPGPPIAKQARPLSKAEQTIGTMDVTCEVLAKAAFPDDKTPTAIAKFLATESGKRFYDDYLQEKRDVGVI
jgi:hypothetical protein